MKKILATLLLFATFSSATVYTMNSETTGCEILFNTFNGEFEYSKQCWEKHDQNSAFISCPILNKDVKQKTVVEVSVIISDAGAYFNARMQNGNYTKYDSGKFTEDIRSGKIFGCYELHHMSITQD